MKAKFESLAIKKIVKESEDCISIELKIPEELEDRFSYNSGQYLTFKNLTLLKVLKMAYEVI